MLQPQSISQWITHLKEGDEEAAQRLWQRYSAQLVALARRRLQGAPRGVADEEDIAASVFHSLCRGASGGRLQDVKNRDDLWWLLLAITKQKVIDHRRRETAQKRGGGRVRVETAGKGNTEPTFTFDQVMSMDPGPEFMIMLQEQHTHLLTLLCDDYLRKVAVSRIDGFTVPEIANDLGVSTRSIERKLALIRGIWSKELEI